jgi:hypothetical protein
MESKDKAFESIVEYIDKSTDLASIPDVRKQLVKKVNETKEKLSPPLESDKWIYRFVVIFLGLAILSSLTFTFFLTVNTINTIAAKDLKIPDIFLAMGSAAVGALAGLLAPSPGHGGNKE